MRLDLLKFIPYSKSKGTLKKEQGMVIILTLATIGLLVSAERILFLYARRTPNQKIIVEEILTKLSEDTSVALTVCEKLKGSPIAEIASLGIKEFHNSQDLDRIMSQMNTTQIKELKLAEERLDLISITGNLLTLAGFLSSVYYMIQAFGVTSSSQAARSIQIKEGVAMAMTCLGTSLAFALTLFVIYTVLKNRENILNSDLNNSALKVFVKLDEIKNKTI